MQEPFFQVPVIIDRKGSDELQKIRDRLILLHRSEHVTRRMLYKLKQHDPTFQLIFTSTPSEISQFFFIPINKSISLYQDIHSTTLKNKVLQDNKRISVITQDDEAYPDRLKNIPDAPLVLYLAGNVPLLKGNPMLSVIGTRKPSKDAFQKLAHIIKPLIMDEWVIVSGLAYGVDSFAHQLTVDLHGKTIAVLGSGFSNIYPKAHTVLCREIVKDGLIISEYPPDVQPKKYHFPERNRIISGLSEGTLVIEAAEKSGTMITVDQALEQGKEIYAVPGSPLIAQTIGCNKLIQDGAKLVTSAADIIEEWPIYQQ